MHTHPQLLLPAAGVRSQPTYPRSRSLQLAAGPHFRKLRAPSASIRRLAERRALDGPPLTEGKKKNRRKKESGKEGIDKLEVEREGREGKEVGRRGG